MKRIGVVTGSRADYGLLRPVLRALVDEPELEPIVYVTGAHLATSSGKTVRQIEADGVAIAERVAIALDGDGAQSVAAAMGLATYGFANAFARTPCDLLVVLGDRYEIHAATSAAVPFRIPIAHIHGGEITEGAIDDALRHSLTKLSHLHLVSAERHAERVRAMGEEPWRVRVVGAPGLDNIRQLIPTPLAELARQLELELEQPFLLVTFHPATLEPDEAGQQIEALVGALTQFDGPIVVTAPNSDAGGARVRARLADFARRRARVRLVDTLGTERYFGLCAHAAAMIGNSSSGLIEAPSFKLPVVNIGSRQTGRLRAANVIDVPAEEAAIARAIAQAITPSFRAGLSHLVNPYGDGHAAARIVAALREAPPRAALLAKKLIEKRA